MLKKRPNRKTVSAVIARFPWTISLICELEALYPLTYEFLMLLGVTQRPSIPEMIHF
jgi:hypothetical protein